VKNDYGQRETQEKISELAVDRDINYVTPLDKTKGRPPFVVRHVRKFRLVLFTKKQMNYFNRLIMILLVVNRNLIVYLMMG
jgi:hypothetical protein